MTFASVPPIDDAAVITISFHGEPAGQTWEAGGCGAKRVLRDAAGD